MPRAFLLTHRRYEPPRGTSPERGVREGGSAPDLSGCHGDLFPSASLPRGSEVPVALPDRLVVYHDRPGACPVASEVPEDLYNLTQLAEVSLAAAAGHIFRPTPNKFEPVKRDGELHSCSDCGKSYSTSSNLARHRQTHRSLADKKARRCPHCDKVYVSMPAYSMHVRTHSQGCKCCYCGKSFSRPWLLQGHIRTHTGEKPFKCPICIKAFADKSNLRAHVQTHSNSKPHVCGRCGKAFALRSYLYKHEEASCVRPQSPCDLSLRGQSLTTTT